MIAAIFVLTGMINFIANVQRTWWQGNQVAAASEDSVRLLRTLLSPAGIQDCVPTSTTSTTSTTAPAVPATRFTIGPGPCAIESDALPFTRTQMVDGSPPTSTSTPPASNAPKTYISVVRDYYALGPPVSTPPAGEECNPGREGEERSAYSVRHVQIHKNAVNAFDKEIERTGTAQRQVSTVRYAWTGVKVPTATASGTYASPLSVHILRPLPGNNSQHQGDGGIQYPTNANETLSFPADGPGPDACYVIAVDWAGSDPPFVPKITYSDPQGGSSKTCKLASPGPREPC